VRQRSLQEALERAQREATQLAAQLQKARATQPELEAARKAAAESEARLEFMCSRGALVERAWSDAVENAKAQYVSPPPARRPVRGSVVFVLGRLVSGRLCLQLPALHCTALSACCLL
jgi:hypothetical protein